MQSRILKIRFLYFIFFCMFLVFFHMSSGISKYFSDYKENGILITAEIEEKKLSDFSMNIKYKVNGNDYNENILLSNMLLTKNNKIDIYVNQFDFNKFVLKNLNFIIYIFYIVTFILFCFSVRFFIKAFKTLKKHKKIKVRCSYCTVYIDGFRDVFVNDEIFKVIRFIYRDNREKCHYIESYPVKQYVIDKIINNDIFTVKMYINRHDLRENYFFEEDIKKY